MEQLPLFEIAVPASDTGGTPGALRRSLHERLDALLADGLEKLVLTDHRTVLVSGHPAERETDLGSRASGWIVRLHWSFALAPDEVVEAVAAVLAGPRRGRARREARRAVRGWIASFRDASGPGPAPAAWQPVIDVRRRANDGGDTAGHVHHLEQLLDEVHRRYFGARMDVEIAWSRAGRAHRRTSRASGRNLRRGRSTLKLGSWSEEDRLVRIHPVLDHPSVPRYVVASIVHHELLHAELGTEIRDGRRHHHTPEFRRREREFADYEAAKRWIEEHLGELLERRARIGS